MAEKGRAGVDLGDIDEHPGAKGQTVESVTVSPHGRFRLGAAGQVVPDVLRQIAPRGDDDFLVGNEIDCHGSLLALKFFCLIYFASVSFNRGCFMTVI